MLSFKTNPLVSMVLTLVTNLLYSVFLTTSFFAIALNLLKSTGIVSNLPISNLSTSDFKLAKSTFLAKCYVSTHVTFISLVLSQN